MMLQLEPHFLLKMKKKYTTVKLHIKNEHPPTRGYSFFLYFDLARLKIETISPSLDWISPNFNL